MLPLLATPASRDDELLIARRGRRTDSHERDTSAHLQLSVAPDASLHAQEPLESDTHDDDDKHKHKLHTSSSSNGSSNVAGRRAAPRKILFLDGVRGIATVLVVTQHASYMHGVNLGHVAVDIFFVLSSFLLTMLFYKKSAQLVAQQASPRAWGIALADYFSKRFFRVYPLFFLVAVFVWLLPYRAQHHYFFVQRPGDFELLRVLTFEFKYRYHVFWTLPLEIAYYFLIPLLVLAVLWLQRAWWLPFPPLYVWIWHNGWYVLRGDHQPLANHLPTFICGSLAAILYVKLDAWIQRHAFEFKTWQVYCIRAVEFVTFWLLVSVLFRSQVFHWLIAHPHQVLEGARFISLHVTLLMVIELVLPSALSTALEWSVLRHWGKIGFSVYLLHSFVIYSPWVQKQRNYYDKLVSQFFLIHVVGTVSFHLLEVPCQRIATAISKSLAQLALEDGTSRPYMPVATRDVDTPVVPPGDGKAPLVTA